MNFNNNINNNIPPNKKEAGTNFDSSEINNNNIDNEISLNNNNYINFENNNNNNINNLNQNEIQYEEEEIEDNESNNNISSSNSNNYLKPMIPTENFSQQVDFLFHPKNPEWQTVNVQNNKFNNNNNKIISQKEEKNINNKKNKNNKKKSKSKNKFNKFNARIGLKKFPNKKLENRPEFDLCTKIEPTPKKYNLSFFYGTKGDSKYEKQVKLRKQKIEQYEEDFLRKKEIYKAKRQREEFELKKNYMNQKYKTSSNFYPKKNTRDEFSQQINNMAKINYPKTNIRNYECNPQKYDIIIHSLLSEISQIKLQREKENRAFEEQIQKLQSENQVKKRPKSVIKNIGNKNNNNSAYKNIQKYFDKNSKKNKRPLTGNKYINKRQNKIEHEIPVNMSKNNTNYSTKKNYYQNEKDKLMQKLKELQIQKQNKINEILELQNKKENEINNNVTNSNNNNNKNESTNNNINYNNPNNIIPIQNISNSPNIILTGPQYLNFNPSINTNILNFQDKAQILTELNNNIAKFTSGIPKLVNKVNEALNKIYANTENPIKKAINNHPFVIMASKATHHTIKKNIDNIVENIIDELIDEMKDELNDIERKENRNIMLNNCGKIQKKLNLIKEDEIIILKKYGN